ncbi:YceI family protein [Aridibaculum aurantiacum]|uniref:YceI family protein n=1 Tax=Aridibaculum aurantiacum TaxID=2810307 RepID=UPI001A95ED93|nr:YceI family protein [Aridibaculum aurantiacum]
MKYIFILLAAIGLTATTVNAQKVYSTKNGKISFYSKAPLEDIEAQNSEVESKLAAATGQVVFTLLIKGFQFENQLMEDHFNENYLESSKYPKSNFKGYVTNIKSIDLNKDGSYPAKVKGELTIHGVTKPLETDGTLEVKGGKVTAKARFPVKLKDHNIGGSMVGKKIAETIVVDVNCQYD